MEQYRTLGVNGSFYPNSCEEIKKYIEYFNSLLEKNKIYIDNTIDPKAIISPHAGYVYSGFTANLAYNYFKNSNYKTIVIIGPSHKVYLEGISVAQYSFYPTPCGDIEIDNKLSNQLIDKFNYINFYPQVHKEHSTETQLPFIQYYTNNNIKVIELIYGKISYEKLSKVIEELYNKDTFFVISTDLSHFYTQQVAYQLDNICLEGIKKYDINILNNGCEACGIIGIKAFLDIAKKHNLKVKILDYRTSGDISNDFSKVVGYTSAVFF